MQGGKFANQVGWKKCGKKSKYANRVDSFIWHLRVVVFLVELKTPKIN